MGEKIDIAVACSANQTPKFWGTLWSATQMAVKRGHNIGQLIAVGSALPDYNKSNIVGGVIRPPGDPNQKKRNNLTDANRTTATSRFLTGNPDDNWQADWLMWFDDDIVIPEEAIGRLLQVEKPAAAGLYFNPNPPMNPLAYIKKEWGGYDALYDYPYGAILPVDSVGLGCCLTHRSIYDAILDAYEIRMRPNGSVFPVKKNIMQPDVDMGPSMEERFNGTPGVLIGDYWVQKVTKTDPDDNRTFPFFSMEYGRTEDHHFWELAAGVGFRPWVDTALNCGHMKMQEMRYERYEEERLDRAGLSHWA